MFREPWRRTMSAYAYFASSRNISARAYANRTKGGVTLQLTGQRYGLNCLVGGRACTHPTPDVAKALQRLAGFAFVGLTEEGALSVCLFHLKFGGRCRDVEFANTRPGAATPPELSASFAAFGGVVDVYDWQLFNAALEIFFADVVQQNISRGKCRQACPEVDPRRFDAVDSDVARLRRRRR